MNNPLIAIKYQSSGLKCDNHGCGYVDPVSRRLTYRVIAENLGRSCPVCGASLLTQQDATTLLWTMRAVRLVNILAFPFMLICLPWNLIRGGVRRHTYRGMMRGTGEVTFTKRDK